MFDGPHSLQLNYNGGSVCYFGDRGDWFGGTGHQDDRRGRGEEAQRTVVLCQLQGWGPLVSVRVNHLFLIKND